MARKRSRTFLTVVALAILGSALVFAFWPRPMPVDLGTVTRGSMMMTIDEEGRTRVHDTFVVSTPVAGRLLRVDVEPGDSVKGGESIVAEMLPTRPSVLDRRTREQAGAAEATAEAALRLARADLNKAIADKELADSELDRSRRLRRANAASQSDLDGAIREVRAADASLEIAEAAISMREAELAHARAQLVGFNDEPLGNAVGIVLEEKIPIPAPISGHVLRVIQQSETTLPAGAPIMEIGDIHSDLEAVVELLSTDAVKASPGDRVIIEDWGGLEPLNAVVERVDPWGFTKFSALGVEEQRVNAVIRFNDDRERQERLGHGFRVEVRIVVWEDEDALIVPSSALFRDGEAWSVFVVEDGEARLRQVDLGRDNGIEAEIRGGLEEGERVILYPSSGLSEGSRVTQRVIQ